MDLSSFESSLAQGSPPKGLSIVLQALWYDANQNWEKAHDLVQEDTSREACRVHAYLHRKEGDLSNAGYWYRKGGKGECKLALKEEWKELAGDFLAQLREPD